MTTKTGLMVGLGETWDELVDAMSRLRDAEIDVLTIGQYLRPSRTHLPLAKYYTPAEFMALRRIGLELGFAHVQSGPLCARATTPLSRFRAATWLPSAEGTDAEAPRDPGRALGHPHRQLLDAAEACTDDDLTWRPGPTSPPIAFHLWHTARWADRWAETLGGAPQRWLREGLTAQWGFAGRAGCRGHRHAASRRRGR